MYAANSPVPRPPAQAYFAPPPPPAPAPVPPPVAPPASGWPMPAPTAPAPVATPGANEPVKAGRTFGAMAMLDLGRIVANPIQTIKSLFFVTRDIIGLQGKRGLTVASSGPALADYDKAHKNLEEAPFRNILPFFDHALNRWAEARFQELRPEVQANLSQRAWHQVVLDWPQGGKGHDRLMEVRMLADVAATATDGQIVRGLVGANRLQIVDSTAMDYFYPLARSGDTLILRRNLPLLPGQKPMAETFKALLNQTATVHIQA